MSEPPFDLPFGQDQPTREPSREGARARDAAQVRSVPAAEGLDVLYYVRVLYRRRWSVATVFILALLAALARNYSAVPVYEARVRVLVEPERLNLVDIQDPVSSQRSLDAELAILQSRWLAKRTVHELGLVKAVAPPATPVAVASTRPAAPPDAWSTRLSGGLAAIGLDVPPAVVAAKKAELRVALQKAFGLDTPGPPREPPSPDETLEEARQIDAFLGGLSVSLNTTGLLDVTYRSGTPAVTAKYANTHAQEYIEQNLEVRLAAVKEVADWLAAQVTEQRQRVDVSEAKLAVFREANGVVALPGAQNPAVARVNELSRALTAARTDRLEKQAAYNRVLALRSDPAALDRLPQMGDAAIQRLRLELEQLQRTRTQLSETLLERHPEMVKAQVAIQATQARLDVERSRVIESLRQGVSAAERAEVVIVDDLAEQEGEIDAQNELGLELNILLRESESNRQVYEMLLQRARDTGIAQDINPKRMRILDGALVPTVPVAPNKRRNLLFGLITGLALAFGLAIGFDYLDSRLRTPDEVQARLGVPFLGLVPELHKKNLGKDAKPLISSGVPAAFTEAVRRLRTNVLFTLPDEVLKTVVFTSTGSEEGKTVVASNLAVGLAYGGKRVLLVDADMRRPSVHTLFGLEQEPGLSNLLVGRAKAKEAMVRSEVPNLWVLTAGRRPPNPSELLGSQQFKTLLDTLRGHFDWVVIDAPPVMAVTDACVIGHTVSGVLFVVGAEMTTSPAARRAIEQLEAVGANVLGAILSRADFDRHGYYYAPYYHPKYGHYYYESPASS